MIFADYWYMWEVHYNSSFHTPTAPNMGVNSSQDSSNEEFYVLLDNLCEFGPAPYPANSQFRERVKESEWNMAAENFNKASSSLTTSIIFCMVLGVASFIVGVAVVPYAFLIWIVVAPGLIYLSVRTRRAQLNSIKRFNRVLFSHRGVLVRYQPGGKHTKASLRIRMVYPATPAAVAQSPPFKNTVACDCMGSGSDETEDDVSINGYAAIMSSTTNLTLSVCIDRAD